MEARKKNINKHSVNLVPKNNSKGNLSVIDPDSTKGGIGLVDETCYTGQGQLKSHEFMEKLAEKHELQYVNITSFKISADVVQKIPFSFCEKKKLVPVQRSLRHLAVAISDPKDISMLKLNLGQITGGLSINFFLAQEEDITAAILRSYKDERDKKLKRIVQKFEESQDDKDVESKSSELIYDLTEKQLDPLVEFTNNIILEAIGMGVSDIHAEIYEKRNRIRFRKDGVLIEKSEISDQMMLSFVNRIKIMAQMNIAERRKPQDGRIKAVSNSDGAGVDFRVNSVPTVFGEKLVLRLLDQSNLRVDLSKLGMEEFQMKMLKKHLHKPQGMILFTGPTGSGKTTTIYSSLSDLNTPEKNVTTAEDPVEYNLDGINQVQINPATGFRFPDALRAFLRQDPEIIMVGEVRDEETAEICYKAASTGHMVISTLHTNDAPSTVTRLVAMNQPTYMVAENTSLVVAQRLVKKICSKCKAPVQLSEEQLIDIGVPQEELADYETLYEGEGCLSCMNTGFAGREAVYEFLELTSSIKKAISDRENALKLKKIAMEDGFVTLRQHALLKLKRGLIPLSEVINATVGDD